MTDETIFAVVLEKPDPTERAAYLASACAGDPEQRKRIEGLLAAIEKAGGFLERPAVGPPSLGPTRIGRIAGSESVDGTTQAQNEVMSDPDDPLGFLMPPQRPDSIGRIGHYEVLEVLGRGGFGIVFRAFDDVLQRVVAVKVLAPSMATTSPARKRFLREARSAALIQHENVVRVHETGETPLPYLVMEFVAGETLQQRFDRTGPLDVVESLKIARQIAEGLAAAHEKSLIHRDIKPSNILIEAGPHERAKITDFGLARAADDASLTRSGAVAGTPMYMAPEQAKGEMLDHRADLFSLGSVLYAMLIGHPPFRAETTLGVLKRVCDDTPRPIREVIPEVPEWLCRIVEKLHAKDPAQRFQTAREVADLLGQYLAHLQQPALVPMPESIATPAVDWLEQLKQSGGPRTGLVAVYCGVILFISITVVVLWGFGRNRTNRAAPPDVMAVAASLAVGGIMGTLVVLYIWRLQWRGYHELINKEGKSISPPRRRLWKWIAVIACSLVLVGWGGLLIWFQKPVGLYISNRGELILEDADPDIAVTVLQQGTVIHDRSSQRSFELDAGVTVEIRVSTVSTDRPLFRRDFIIDRGKQFRINIAHELAATEQQNRDRITNDLSRIAAAIPNFQTDNTEAQEQPSSKPNVPPLAIVPFNEVQAKQLQEAWAKHLGVKSEIENSVGMKLRLIPPGTFTMGADNKDERKIMEGPPHKVTVNGPFYIGVYEVTRGQYEAVLKPAKPSPKEALDLPVTMVSWHEARDFCKKLSEQEEEKKAGRTYRLASEIEWEYACRAGTDTPYYFGPMEKIDEYAWFKDNAADKLHAVGLKKPNAWGLYDMIGNASELCEEGFELYKADSVIHDPTKPIFGDGTGRVVRSGNFKTTAKLARSTYRGMSDPTFRSDGFGFRVVVIVEAKK